MLRLAARRSTAPATAATAAAATAGARAAARRPASTLSLLHHARHPRPHAPTPLTAAATAAKAAVPILRLLFLQSPALAQQQQRRGLASGGGGPGGQAWVSPDAVPKGENLRKFSRNLTKEAMEGKLDPVIGRDDVIRRVVQVGGWVRCVLYWGGWWA